MVDKNKDKKKDKYKNKEERQAEVDRMRHELSNLGLSNEIDGISDFYKYCEEYIEKDISWSGRIKLFGTKRILEAILPRKKIVKGTLALKYDEHI